MRLDNRPENEGGYAHARNFETSDEEDPKNDPDRERRYRKPPTRYPEGEWVRKIYTMPVDAEEVALALLDLRYGPSAAEGNPIRVWESPFVSRSQGGNGHGSGNCRCKCSKWGKNGGLYNPGKTSEILRDSPPRPKRGKLARNKHANDEKSQGGHETDRQQPR